jgi:hypothetical protein
MSESDAVFAFIVSWFVCWVIVMEVVDRRRRRRSRL